MWWWWWSGESGFVGGGREGRRWSGEEEEEAVGSRKTSARERMVGEMCIVGGRFWVVGDGGLGDNCLR